MINHTGHYSSALVCSIAGCAYKRYNGLVPFVGVQTDTARSHHLAVLTLVIAHNFAFYSVIDISIGSGFAPV